MAKNKDFTMEEILRVFDEYENGCTMQHCMTLLGVSRKTIRYYFLGTYRNDCYTEHLKKYPNGRISNYSNWKKEEEQTVYWDAQVRV